MGKWEGRLQLVRARIEKERVSGGRVERERALRLAYVVATHGLLAELEDEFRTIVDLERLALRLKPGKRGGAGYLTMSLFNLVESMRSACYAPHPWYTCNWCTAISFWRSPKRC